MIGSPQEAASSATVLAATTPTRQLPINAPGVAIAPGDPRVFLATGTTTTVLDSSNAVLATYRMKPGEFEVTRPRQFDAAMIAFPPGQPTATGSRTLSSKSSSTGSS